MVTPLCSWIIELGRLLVPVALSARTIADHVPLPGLVPLPYRDTSFLLSLHLAPTLLSFLACMGEMASSTAVDTPISALSAASFLR